MDFSVPNIPGPKELFGQICGLWLESNHVMGIGFRRAGSLQDASSRLGEESGIQILFRRTGIVADSGVPGNEILQIYGQLLRLIQIGWAGNRL